jgi:hypothetical protein
MPVLKSNMTRVLRSRPKFSRVTTTVQVKRGGQIGFTEAGRTPTNDSVPA